MNIFDFTNTSDLPEDMQKKLAPVVRETTTAGRDNIVRILTAANKAGVASLTLNQIKAVMIRENAGVEGYKPLGDQTLRRYIKEAEKAELSFRVGNSAYTIDKAVADEAANLPADPPADEAASAETVAPETAEEAPVADAEPVATTIAPAAEEDTAPNPLSALLGA